MNEVNRKVTYKLYPNKAQASALREMLVLHQRLYNNCLEQRKWAWEWRKRIEKYRDLTEEELKRFRRTCSFYGQVSQLKDIRAVFPDYKAIPYKSSKATFQRLDRAYQNFFRRLREGKTGREAGFPRFKSVDRFPGFGFEKHGNGWRFTPGSEWKHGRLRIKGIEGTIKCRGRARTPGEIKTCELLHHDGVWHLSLTVACEPERQCGTEAVGLDWGVATFATLVSDKGTIVEVDNPRFLERAERKLKREQRSLSRKVRGSSNRRKQRIQYGRAFRHLANRRRDHHHQLTKRLVNSYRLIATEKLTVKGMTATAKGTAEKPGKNVKVKAGLNRSILDTGPGAFLQMLRYKLEEAGGEWVEVPTRKVKPSQTCPNCGHQRKKRLSERTHKCEVCGYTESRDRAAARVMLHWALNGSPVAAAA